MAQAPSSSVPELGKHSWCGAPIYHALPRGWSHGSFPGPMDLRLPSELRQEMPCLPLGHFCLSSDRSGCDGTSPGPPAPVCSLHHRQSCSIGERPPTWGAVRMVISSPSPPVLLSGREIRGVVLRDSVCDVHPGSSHGRSGWGSGCLPWQQKRHGVPRLFLPCWAALAPHRTDRPAAPGCPGVAAPVVAAAQAPP